jgi:hypothetical protein
MFAGLERFSVSAPGRGVNEYRIHGGKLELRTRDPKAKSARHNWRRLETSEVMLHLLLDTVVAQWLMGRRGFHVALGAQGFGVSRRLHKQAA